MGPIHSPEQPMVRNLNQQEIEYKNKTKQNKNKTKQ